MSRPNRDFFSPAFAFTVQQPNYAFAGQVTRLDINPTQQCIISSPRSVQHRMPSPSTSVRTVRTAPDPRLFSRSNFHDANRSPIDENIDPSLTNDNASFLAPPSHHSKSSYNSIARHLQDQPWSGCNLRSSGRNALNQSSVQYASYRGSPGSDLESNVLQSDSGYHSQPPRSVFSNEPSRSSQELPANINYQVQHLNVESTPSEAPAMTQLHSDQISQHSSRSGRSTKVLQCQECHESLKCKSDLKKHMLKHAKPFKCGFPSCKRAEQGFTTVNDLDRHKKSVHRIGLINKSYQCASKTCRNKEKIWPRLDNFKQHIDRMHKDENELDLIKRSTFRPASVPNNVAVAPMDTNLAVAGMGRSFPGNPAMDTVPTINLPADHDARHWPSPDPGLNEFSEDMYRMSTQFCGSISGSSGIRPQESQRLHEPQLVYQRASGIIARRHSQAHLTNTTTPVASVESINMTQQQELRPLLSNAPQTKLEQQNSTLQKFSRTIINEVRSASSSDTVDLEDLVLRMLQKAADAAKCDDRSPHQKNMQEPQDKSDAVTLTQDEALRASQMISSHIKQSPGSAYTVQRRSTQGFILNAKICPKCDYAVARDCDLRKHMKRHERPYGCTYPRCHKRFGAKSDWKRHENSQHFQLEAFRCTQPSQSSLEVACGQHFFRAKLFDEHLETQHKMPSPEQRSAEATRCKIGKNCQVQFWCGFCVKVIELKKRRNAAWDERFDHIAEHFDKGKKSIDEWVCVEENKKKKCLLKDMDRHVFDDEEERDAGDIDDEIPPPPRTAVPQQWSVPRNPGAPSPPEAYAQGNPKKRAASVECTGSERRQKQTKTTKITNRYCCSCGHGPCSSLQPACVTCGHESCSSCGYEEEWMYA